jgi:hypothetical protein
VALLNTICTAQQELLTSSRHEPSAAISPASAEYFKVFATVWHSDYRGAKGRRKLVTKHWWRTRTDPFAQSWSLVEGWLAAEPSIGAKELLMRLTKQLPDLYPTGAQLRTLRRVKTWRAERARQLVFGATAEQKGNFAVYTRNAGWRSASVTPIAQGTRCAHLLTRTNEKTKH